MTMRRVVGVLAVLVALAAAPGSAAGSWAKPQIETVVAAGLMAPTVAEFRPDDALTKGELADLVVALGGVTAPPADPSLPVKLRELDAALVRLLGLGPAAKHVRAVLAAAGLEPPSHAGTEVVARLLGLRTNHPQTRDAFELRPGDRVTRAETAFSAARTLELEATDAAGALAAPAAKLALPELTDWQRRVLQRAVRFVGYPYIWGGSSERPQAPFGVTVPGGFDCSGLAWRLYKLEPFAEAPGLADVLQGRTTYAMSGEVDRSLRIGLDAVEPADVLFFGERGPQSRPSQIGHMGIYLGGGWMAHASTRGTTLVPLEGWYSERFAWARRPLAEAGLA
jgi:cell wall-associated NlpC family hydrolase